MSKSIGLHQTKTEERMRKLLMLGLLGALVSCGNNPGSKEGDSASEAELPQAAAGAIGGTAAIGAPMADARIVIKGDNCSKEGKANGKGVYSVQLSDCTGPYLISAESAVGKVYSVATEEDLGSFVNVTPLTQVVAARALEVTDFSAANPAGLTRTKITDAVGEIQTAISGLASAFGASAVDIRSGAFAANGAQLDKVLDAISVSTVSGAMEIAVKGSTVTVQVPASTAGITGSIDAAAVSAAEEAMSEFDKMKKDLLGGINNCLSKGTSGKSCYLSFFDQYLNDGLTAEEEWNDIAWPGMSVSYINPVLIELNPAKTEAWVSSTARERDGETGNYYTWLQFSKLQKVSGVWKIVGNKFPYKFHPQASAVIESGQMKKAINFRIWYQQTEAIAAKSFSFSSTDLGLASGVSGEFSVEEDSLFPGEFYSNISVAEASRPDCATDIYSCQKMIVVSSPKDVAFNKYQITIDGQTYTGIIPSLPKATSVQEVPGFTNLSGNVCGEYPGHVNPAPATLQWRLPSGFILEEAHFNNTGAYENWNFDYDFNMEATSTPFLSGIELDPAAGGSYVINRIELMFEFRDQDERAYFLPYGCQYQP